MSVLVTGANRGIGLELVRQLVKLEKSPRYVFATYRSKGTTQELENIKKSCDRCQVILIQADVTKKEDVKSLRNSIEEIVGDKGLNLLINNAGGLRLASFENLTEEDLLFHFETNTVGPVTVFKEMLPLLEKGIESNPNGELFQLKVLNMSSLSGSIGELSGVPSEWVGPTISYRTSKELENIKKSSDRCQVILIQVDVTNKEDVKSLRNSIEEIVGDKGLNLLINNAGALRMGSFENLTEEDLLFHFKTNTVGPFTVFKEMLPLLEKGVHSKAELSQVKVLNISSMAGSIGDLGGIPMELVGPTISYRTSKAALNMAMRSIAIVLKDKGILMVNMCPGWVRTDMGSSSADIDVTESVSAMLKTLPTLDQSRHGDFMDRHGKAIAY